MKQDPQPHRPTPVRGAVRAAYAPAHHDGRPVRGTGGAGVDGAEARAESARATGILMALVPCTAETARRLLGNAALAAGVTHRLMARTVLATRTRPDDVDPDRGRALRAEIEHARSAPPVPAPAGDGPQPAPDVLRRQLNLLRSARRRTLAAPDDPTLRADLEDAAYTLCVLTGQRSAHCALVAAEEAVAAHRLPPAGSRGLPPGPAL
ncbi:DUF5133 domain-containing protein [Streptomyces sp. NPDC085612]|uniref:DUF5133 domain-containing protein n=1 Tax=Streptomyces sp. NPDC085612 TaxID=3365732 RepID=UPI0037D6B23C